MRKTVLCLMLFICVIAKVASAQDSNTIVKMGPTISATNQGNVEFAGEGSYRYQSRPLTDEERGYRTEIDAYKDYYGDIDIRAHYFIFNNLSAGLEYSYHYNGYDYGSGKRSYWRASFGPGIRLYIGDNRIRPFLGTSYNYYFGNPSYRYSIKAGAGLTYLINNSIGISSALKYQYINSKSDRYKRETQLTVEIGIQTFLKIFE